MNTKHRRDANSGVAPVLLIGGDADATLVAWTVLSKQFLLAGVLTRRQEWRRTTLARRYEWRSACAFVW